MSLSRCGTKVQNKMASKFEFRTCDGLGNGGLMGGGKSCERKKVISTLFQASGIEGIV